MVTATFRAFIASVELVIPAAVTAAQTPMPPQSTVVNKAVITLNRCPSAPGQIIKLVIDDADRFEYEVKDEKGEWVARNTRRFDAEDAHASARINTVDGAVVRTDCQNSTRERDAEDRDRWVARFLLTCSETAATNVAITADGVDVAYVRRMTHRPRNAPDCKERAVFESTYTVHGVQFPSETLRLQFGVTQPNADGSGLLVNEIVRSITTSDWKGLSPQDVVHSMTAQWVKGDASAPGISPAAIDVYAEVLKDARLKSLRLKVR